jgi:formylglycine-generating enzyme required for sulfatase activity
VRDAIRAAVWICCAAAGLALTGITESQAAGRRVALVVGNSAYKLGPLANPVHDAEALAEALERQLRFDRVLLRRNLGLDAFRAALKELAREARGAEVGLVFFAGHGIETKGRNYLIPTDAALAGGTDTELEAIALDTVLHQLEGVTKLRVVILDACRNSPFPAAERSWRGLKAVAPELGTIVAYAAKEGTLAADGKGRHSPFAEALLKRLVTPGLDVRRLFGYVRSDVRAATGGRQEPGIYSELGGDEVFLSAASSSGAALTKPPVAPQMPKQPAAGDIAAAWAAAKDSTSVSVLEAFRERYGRYDSFYDSLARDRIAALQKPKLTLATPPPPLALFADRKPAPLTAAEERGLKPKDSFKECAECPEMVVVPAGSFTMGSPPVEEGRHNDEGPQHRVTIGRPFAVGRFEVTFSEWDACVVAHGCSYRPSDQGWGRGKRPVINVSWHDVTQQYLPWLSRRTDKTYRLLTEAEWEYVARAGTTTRYHFGHSENELCAYGNVADLTAVAKYPGWRIANCRDGYMNTAPVGSFRPNAFGLFDTHGNVREWVQDCSNGSYNGSPTDGSAWVAGDCGYRIYRGGSWEDFPSWTRAAVRLKDTPVLRYYFIGFRVGRTL